MTRARASVLRRATRLTRRRNQAQVLEHPRGAHVVVRMRAEPVEVVGAHFVEVRVQQGTDGRETVDVLAQRHRIDLG